MDTTESEVISNSTEELNTKVFTDPVHLYMRNIARPAVGSLLSFRDVISQAISCQKYTFFRLAYFWLEAGARDIGDEERLKKLANEIKMARRYEDFELLETLNAIDQILKEDLTANRLSELKRLVTAAKEATKFTERESLDRKVGQWHCAIAKLYKNTIDCNRSLPKAITPEIPTLHTRKAFSTRVHIKQYGCSLTEETLEELLEVRWMYVTEGIIHNLSAIGAMFEVNPWFAFRYMNEKASIMVPRKQKEDVFLIDNIERVKKSLPTSDTVRCNKWNAFVTQVNLIAEVLEIDTPEKLADTICEGAWAQDYLISHNLKLCVQIATRFNRSGSAARTEFLDTIQEGNLGLMSAIMKFNPGLGYQLSTYETHWMRQAISRNNSKEGRSIRLPTHITDKINAKKRITRTLTQRNGKNPAPEEIVEESIRETVEYNLVVVQQISEVLTGKDYSTFDSIESIKEDVVRYFYPDGFETPGYKPPVRKIELTAEEFRLKAIERTYKTLIASRRNSLRRHETDIGEILKRQEKLPSFPNIAALQELQRYDRTILSTDQCVQRDDSDTTLGEVLPDPNQNVMDAVGKQHLNHQLMELLKEVIPAEDERGMFLMRFGLTGDGKSYSLAEISEFYNRTYKGKCNERIRQIIDKNLNHLRFAQDSKGKFIYLDRLREMKLLLGDEE